VKLKPIDKMQERVVVAKEDSDTAYFHDLLYLGEMVTKIITAGLVSAILPDRERHQYRQLHKLVRADGIGEWSAVIDDILTGPASQYLRISAREEQKELTQKCSAGTWQFEAVSLLYKCLIELNISIDDLKTVVDGRKWFVYFTVLRNKTRGHGAPTGSQCANVIRDLETSITTVIDNFKLFKREWAYLHRNLSGKYRIIKLSDCGDVFEYLKSSTEINLPDGVYTYFDEPCFVELLKSDLDSSSFYLPNGGFNGKKYEMISYIDGDKRESDASHYLIPASELPTSETQGKSNLDIQGRCLGNLPPIHDGYIERVTLEADLFKVLSNDRHPVVTLVGRGGIGKTSLALSVLHKISQTERFDAILWFSARDIDLLPQGPKLVKPHVLTEKDIADEYVRLTEPIEAKTKGFKSTEYMAAELTKSSIGSLLLIFDNFETVRNPIELYTWIDTYIRLPNKVLITTRFRDFKGDYPIEVLGMSEAESDKLIDATCTALRIEKLLTDDYKNEIFKESEGHPYVIKVLLGEVAKADNLVKIQRIIAGKDEILDALFERTYSGLTPVAKRVFLTLCNWKSIIPQLAIEAVLLRPDNEKMDVSKAIEELTRSSFIEVAASKDINDTFVSVPLAASVFGERKLAVDATKSAIEADTKILRYFGASQFSDIKHGLKPRVERLFKQIAENVSKGKNEIKEYEAIIKFIARKYPSAYLLLSRLYEEQGTLDDLVNAKEAVRHYLEFAEPSDAEYKDAWRRLAELSRRTDDTLGEIQALLELCQKVDVSYSMISEAANRLNAIFRTTFFQLDTEEKQTIVKRLINVMEERIDEADATDLSRLAWLYLNQHDGAQARRIVALGLEKDPDNEYCLKLSRTGQGTWY
jgi:tetratricopeptide (TPR) repeat protein